MTIIRLRKEREAKVFTSEDYKSAIRTYMESMGYAQTTDSTIEGHLPDMIFVPPAERPWPREIWVEAKATKLSLSNQDFGAETISYLENWLSRSPISRFKLMIFVENLRNSSRWGLIWGKDLSQAEILKWLQGTVGAAEVEKVFAGRDENEVFPFFTETEVIEADVTDLLESAERRRKEGTSAMETRRHARELLSLMERRERPISKKSIILANLLQFSLPQSYQILEVQPLTRSETWNALLGHFPPPYSFISSGRILTLGLEGARERFTPLNPTKSDPASLSEIEMLYPNNLLELVNDALDQIIRPRGVGKWMGWYYFLANREVSNGIPRTIEVSDRTKMRVARPLFSKEVEGDFGKRKLNFVYHVGFRVRCRRLWNQYFVEIRARRLYTSEGATVIEGTKAARIDSRFRKPRFNRAKAQETRLVKLADYFFHSRLSGALPSWTNLFVFHDFLTIPVDWIPASVDIGQTFLLG